MFEFFKKKKVTYEMKAVVDGTVVPMTEATDPVFSSCALGNGVVIRPTSDVIVAPADGTVTVTMDGSNHAIGLELAGGLEVLIHIGVDTVNLKGEGFEALAMTDSGAYANMSPGVASGDVQYTTGVTAKAGETIVGIWQ
mgnify:CR=1 FL=1